MGNREPPRKSFSYSKKFLLAVFFLCASFLSSMLGIFSFNFAHSHPQHLLKQIEDNQKTLEKNKGLIKKKEKDGRVLFEIKAAPLWFLSPVHEKMTALSITLSKVHRRAYSDRYHYGYVHGVFWNDDPEFLLCRECAMSDPEQFGRKWGINWARRFMQVKSLAQGTPPKFFTNGDSVLGRSHFGDMQFLHSMAEKDGEPARETLKKILIWSEFVYKVAIGQLPPDTLIKDVPDSRIVSIFMNHPDIYFEDVAHLFHTKKTKTAAIGSLMHIIQDSFAPGHVDRVIEDFWGNGKLVFSRGAIKSFHSYTHQDPQKHSKDDEWPESLENSTSKSATAKDPINICSQILKMIYSNDGKGAPWPEMERYLKGVFRLLDPDAPAGPGEQYKMEG